MFKVQRFTAEEEEEQGGGSRDDPASILNKVLERAKARASAKRARLGPGDDTQHQAGTGVAPTERRPGITGALGSGADSRRVSDGRGVRGGASRSGQGLTAAESGKDRAGAAVQEEGEEEEEEDEFESDIERAVHSRLASDSFLSTRSTSEMYDEHSLSSTSPDDDDEDDGVDSRRRRSLDANSKRLVVCRSFCFCRLRRSTLDPCSADKNEMPC